MGPGVCLRRFFSSGAGKAARRRALESEARRATARRICRFRTRFELCTGAFTVPFVFLGLTSITHAEIHGRTTAFDIGLARMVSEAKDCIGKTMAARPGLVGPERDQLVGLRPIGEVKQIIPGAHLFAPEAEAVSENDEELTTVIASVPS